VSEDTQDIKNLFQIFLKEHIEMFQSSNKQYISTILFNILEELALFNIFEIEDMKNIYEIGIPKYNKVYEITKDATNKFLIENNNQLEENKSNLYSGGKSKSDVNYIFCDISEFKASILSLFNTCYIHFYHKCNFSLAQILYKVNKNIKNRIF